MKPFLIPLLTLSFGVSSVLADSVTNTFDTDLGDFTGGADATNGGSAAPSWSDFNGGSMMLDFVGGWAPAKANLDLVTSVFATTFQSALTNGGSISFDLTVRTDDILGGFPGWFEPMLTGSSQGIDDRPFAGDDGFPAYYGDGAWPAGAVRTTTVTLPIEAAAGGVDNDGRLQVNPNSSFFRISLGLNSQSGAAFTHGKYFIDNFKVTSNAVAVVVPPPAIAIEKTVPGLNIYSSGAGQYDRQTLRTATPQYSWVGAGAPVTYSITISDYSAKAGMGTVFYLVPGTGLGTGDNYPDYGQPRCIAGYLNNNANGTGYLRLAFKNELANSNGQSPNDLYGNGNLNNLWPDNPAWVEGDPKKPGTGIGGTLCSVNGASILGKWSITFTSNTSVTITAPSGETATGALPNEATAQLFADPMYAYFGTIPGEPSRIGERVVFSGIGITGGANQINTDIVSAMTDGLLEKSATSPTGIVFINPSDNPYWFTWTLPATDYKLQQSVDLGNTATWENIPLTGSLNVPGGKRLLLSSGTLSNLDKNYLRMAKPPLVP